MSWLRIDDKFEDNAKVEPLSDAAHRLWMRAACWCKKPENAHTNGFVPAALIEVIAKRSAPKPKLLKLALELVNANAGGTKEHGLWVPEEGGWRFHDWWKYQAPTDDRGGNDDNTPRAKSEAGKLGGRRSAEVRRARFGSAQPKQPEAELPKQTPKQPEAPASEAEPEAPRSTSEAPDPVPDPDQPETTIQGPDSSERAEAPSGVVVIAENQRIPCPPDLDLTPDQRANLAISPGIPDWAIKQIRDPWVTGELGDPSKTMTLAQWRKCLSKVCCNTWNDSSRRPRKAEPRAEATDDSADALADINRQLGYAP